MITILYCSFFHALSDQLRTVHGIDKNSDVLRLEAVEKSIEIACQVEDLTFFQKFKNSSQLTTSQLKWLLYYYGQFKSDKKSKTNESWIWTLSNLANHMKKASTWAESFLVAVAIYIIDKNIVLFDTDSGQIHLSSSEKNDSKLMGLTFSTVHYQSVDICNPQSEIWKTIPKTYDIPDELLEGYGFCSEYWKTIEPELNKQSQQQENNDSESIR